MPRKKAAPKGPKPRRPRGSGSLFRDSRRGVWVGRIHGQEFRSAEQAKVVEWLRTSAPPAPGAAVTVASWCDRWLAGLNPAKVSAGTKANYVAHVVHRIKPTLGGATLDKLTAWDVEEAMAKWDAGAAVARNTLSTIVALLQAARRAKLVAENVGSLVRRPPAPEQSFDLFDRPELRVIFDAGLSRGEWGTFAILAGTGCRIGEAIALEPGDFDPAGPRLSIQRTWKHAGIGKPKSRLSRRTIAVPAELAPVLAAGPPRVSYATALRRWRELLADRGLRFRNMHQVRHSFASHLLAGGAPVADLAQHLGHTPAELLKTYAHKTGRDMGAEARGLLGL